MFVVAYLDHGRKAVGGAGSAADEGHVGGVLLLVHTQHDRGRVVLRGGRENNFLHATVDMGLASGGGKELTGRFAQVINPHLPPGDLTGNAGLRGSNSMAVDDQVIAININFSLITTVDGIILELISHILDIRSRIDRLQIAVGVIKHHSSRQAADSAKPVDSHTILARHYDLK